VEHNGANLWAQLQFSHNWANILGPRVFCCLLSQVQVGPGISPGVNFSFWDSILGRPRAGQLCSAATAGRNIKFKSSHQEALSQWKFFILEKCFVLFKVSWICIGCWSGSESVCAEKTRRLSVLKIKDQAKNPGSEIPIIMLICARACSYLNIHGLIHLHAEMIFYMMIWLHLVELAKELLAYHTIFTSSVVRSDPCLFSTCGFRWRDVWLKHAISFLVFHVCASVLQPCRAISVTHRPWLQATNDPIPSQSTHEYCMPLYTSDTRCENHSYLFSLVRLRSDCNERHAQFFPTQK